VEEMDSTTEEISKQIEEEFFKLYNSGGDISFFIYFPYDIIPPRVQQILDTFLMERAYDKLSHTSQEDLNILNVYSDDSLNLIIDLKDNERKNHFLDDLINHFSDTEEYEKCAAIKTFKK
jgi:hypothetical protein